MSNVNALTITSMGDSELNCLTQSIRLHYYVDSIMTLTQHAKHIDIL